MTVITGQNYWATSISNTVQLQYNVILLPSVNIKLCMELGMVLKSLMHIFMLRNVLKSIKAAYKYSKQHARTYARTHASTQKEREKGGEKEEREREGPASMTTMPLTLFCVPVFNESINALKQRKSQLSCSSFLVAPSLPTPRHPAFLFCFYFVPDNHTCVSMNRHARAKIDT